MDTIKYLKNTYNYAERYKNNYIGGSVPPWIDYLKSRRIYKGETMREFMIRIAKQYEDDIRNDKLLDKLDSIQQNILSLLDKIVAGVPVSVAAVQKPAAMLANMPHPPPPPPPPPKPKKELSATEIAQLPQKDKMMIELKERLAKRGVIQASGGRKKRRVYKRY